jgi:hypothetical protein
MLLYSGLLEKHPTAQYVRSYEKISQNNNLAFCYTNYLKYAIHNTSINEICG